MFKIMETPIGNLKITEEDQYLIGIELTEEDAVDCKSEILDEAERQIREYFEGTRREFSLSYRLSGSDFQLAVLSALALIPYGKTVTYTELAQAVGKPNARRAVGGALNRNPLLILLPCHRVLGSDRSLTGFAAGLKNKEFLLKHEGSI